MLQAVGGGFALQARRQGGGGRCGVEVVFVGAVLDLGAAQHLGRVRAQVVGAVVFHGGDHKGVVGAHPPATGGAQQGAGVATIQRVVNQGKGPTRTQVAHAALAFKALGVAVQGSQRNLGGALGVFGVLEPVGTTTVVHLQRGQFAQAQRAVGLGAHAGHALVVPAAQAHRVGPQAALCHKGGHAVALAGFVGGHMLAGKTQLAQLSAHLALALAATDDHHRARLARVVGGGALHIVQLIPVVHQTFFGQQALHKGQVGLLVLGAQAAHAQGVAHLGAPVGLRCVVAQHRFNHLQRRHVVKHPAVAPQAGQMQPWHQRHRIPRQPTVSTQLRGLRHIAVPRAVLPVAVQQLDGDLLTHQAL